MHHVLFDQFMELLLDWIIGFRIWNLCGDYLVNLLWCLRSIFFCQSKQEVGMWQSALLPFDSTKIGNNFSKNLAFNYYLQKISELFLENSSD